MFTLLVTQIMLSALVVGLVSHLLRLRFPPPSLSDSHCSSLHRVHTLMSIHHHISSQHVNELLHHLDSPVAMYPASTSTSPWPRAQLAQLSKKKLASTQTSVVSSLSNGKHGKMAKVQLRSVTCFEGPLFLHQLGSGSLWVSLVCIRNGLSLQLRKPQSRRSEVRFRRVSSLVPSQLSPCKTTTRFSLVMDFAVWSLRQGPSCECASAASCVVFARVCGIRVYTRTVR